jgi:hypothetical protein
VENGFTEPVSKIFWTASLICRWRRLRLAISVGGRVFDANMEVIIVPVHRANVGKPNSVALGFAAKCFLDGRIDEYSFDLWLLRGRANDEQMTWGKDLWVDVEAIGPYHHCCRHFFALDAGQFSIWHRRQPNFCIEPHLMTGVSGQHGATPRLRQVAHRQSGPTRNLVHLTRKALEQPDNISMGPIAVVGQPHHLPDLAIDRQCLSACEAAFRVKADGANGQRSGQGFAGKEFFCAKVWIAGVTQWRERFRFDAAFVLRRNWLGYDRQDDRGNPAPRLHVKVKRYSKDFSQPRDGWPKTLGYRFCFLGRAIGSGWQGPPNFREWGGPP